MKYVFWERRVSLNFETLSLKYKQRNDIKFTNDSWISICAKSHSYHLAPFLKNKRWNWWTWFICFKAIYSGNTSRIVCITRKRFIRKADFAALNNVYVTVKMHGPEWYKTFSDNHFNIIILLQIAGDSERAPFPSLVPLSLLRAWKEVRVFYGRRMYRLESTRITQLFCDSKTRSYRVWCDIKFEKAMNLVWA